jgi:hypothetical protein
MRMNMIRFVGVAVIASFLVTALPGTIWAGDKSAPPVSVDFQAAIDRAAAALPASIPAAKARQGMGGGGGGKGMMIWTVVGTVTSLAMTYFVIKEVRKQTDKALQQQ